MTRQTVNAFEAGNYWPFIEVAFRVSRVFEKPLGEVFRPELLDLRKVGMMVRLLSFLLPPQVPETSQAMRL